MLGDAGQEPIPQRAVLNAIGFGDQRSVRIGEHGLGSHVAASRKRMAQRQL
jgi:hypothetical protein